MQFLETAVRWYPQDGRCGCTSWSPSELQSLTTLGSLLPAALLAFRHRAPHAAAAQERPPALSTRRASSGRTRGAGLAFALPWDATLYGFAEATLDAGPSLDALGRVRTRSRARPLDRQRGGPLARARLRAGYVFALGDTTTWVRAGVEQRLTLGRNTALELETGFERDFGGAGRALWPLFELVLLIR